MKAGYLLPVLLGFLGAVVAFEVGSLSGYIDEIPTCSLSAFARAMNQEGCDTSKVDGSDIECLCKHAGFIARDVARDVEAPCALGVSTLLIAWLTGVLTSGDLVQTSGVLSARPVASGSPGAPQLPTFPVQQAFSGINFAARAQRQPRRPMAHPRRQARQPRATIRPHQTLRQTLPGRPPLRPLRGQRRSLGVRLGQRLQQTELRWQQRPGIFRVWWDLSSQWQRHSSDPTQ